MNGQHLEMATYFDQFIESAGQNLTIAKLLNHLQLDPTNITFGTILQRLAELLLANINVANMCAVVGAGFYAATFLMRTMVPLRAFGIISAFFFMAYGALAGAFATFLLYLLLLPINSLRLFQILKLVKKAQVVAQEEMSVDWLKPFMDRRNYRKGDVVFRKGDRANEMLLITTGRFLVREIGVELSPGNLVGELGFLAPNNKRTQTVECIENGAVLTISYDRLLEVYFAYPDFAIYLLRLSSNRLLQNNARLEATIEQYRGRLQAATTNVR
jgi:CRP-like cAMP-binding protein